MISFENSHILAGAMRRAELAHAEYEKTLGMRDSNWSEWYAEFMGKEQHEALIALSTNWLNYPIPVVE